MSSTKSKKKSKSTKLPEPMKIKREDDHIIHPMEHYVDDRVELIRQIFASLKPKTITNLAPDFLKKSQLEEIQEQCLNEILGISKKRLLSIINSTKCPTDTETSSEDDVNAVNEHISLEEISSDSDLAESKGSKAGAVAGRKKKKIKVEGKAEGEANNKQFSVLELLELQARARAIRSQLALEPVTKIEVGTDSEEDGPPAQKPPSAKAAAEARKKSSKTSNGGSTNSKSASAKKPESTLTVIIPNGDPVPAKRIKLKRNFRKPARDEESNEDNQPKADETTEKIVPKIEERSPSPDVIPVVSQPETLCISDSDEEKKESKVEEKEPEKASNQVEILSVVSIESSSKKPESKPEEASKPEKSPRKNTPPDSEEEGEIVEEEEEEAIKNKPETIENSSKADASPDNLENKDSPKEKQAATTEIKESTAPVGEKSDPKLEQVCISESDDDENDDVISLEGGDLVDEMKEHMVDDAEDVKKEEKHDDVICLEDSSEDEALTKKKTESWNDRWLNSRRVSKVLAASRLGNKVRNKIKESKKAKKLEQAAAAVEKEQEKPQQVVFVSKHELGSVEQYKEILESLPRKSTDSNESKSK